ncbi:cyclic-di-AMP-binding protein CbpB [Alicyclobacillus fodiniaquatilis]|uniref:Cyclic-di-AMP-binding protein CbpB n=1 Tax=Alicyclobacillus fodiniaquatilis TaxID=1661150 RepID=A0ABW4JMA3_9BACL
MLSIRDFTLRHEDIRRMVIDAEDVACVHPAHSAEHALLVLIKSGYSAIPVVASDGKVVGTISKTLILDKILGLERIEFEALSTYTVADAMNPEVARIASDQSFMRALQLSIDWPFLCVENDEGIFTGLMTRRGILALIHHEIQRENRD